jgi:hypothetical protein
LCERLLTGKFHGDHQRPELADSEKLQVSTRYSRSLFSAADVQRTNLMSVCGEQRESREHRGTLHH